jgi:glyoxylase-like metal-dependent hydrolase (beta-lactamase superfamily II)
MAVVIVMGIVLGIAACFDAQAQSPWSQLSPPPPQPTDFSSIEIKTTQLSSNFHTLDGLGGRISVLSGPDGVLLVDSEYAPLTDRLVAAIRQFTDQPIRFLIDTHLHPDHTGGNENFAKLGAVIFARDALRDRLEHPIAAPDGSPGKPAPGLALPVVTYDAPVTIHIDGEEVHLIPIRAAHTDGDTVVSFPAHDILAVGDIFRSLGYPYSDLRNGGSLPGMLDGLAQLIGLVGPNTKVIPGHGPITDRAALIAQRDLILALRAKVAAMIAQGKSIDDVVAAKLTADSDAQVPQGAQTAERFVRWVYVEVKAGH